MKNTILCLLACAVVVLAFVLVPTRASAWGNKQMWDSTHTFNNAMVKLADGSVVSGPCDSWLDFPDGDQVQVTIDGTTYLVHFQNATLIHSK